MDKQLLFDYNSHSMKNRSCVGFIFFIFILLIHPSTLFLLLPDSFTRYPQEPAQFESIEELFKQPTKINTQVESYTENKGRRIRARSDFHAVFDQPLERVALVLGDHEHEDAVYPNIDYSRDHSPEAGFWDNHLQEVKVSFKILGIGADYHYLLKRLPQKTSEGNFLITWYLKESFDGKIEHMEGSWFVMELYYKGHKYTYVRNYMDTIFVNPPAGTVLALSLFSSRETRTFFDALYQAAKKLPEGNLPDK